MKFLLIRFSSIGDIVLTTPVIRCLKKQVPTADIHFLTKKQFLPVLQGNPYLAAIHTIEQDPGEVLEKLKAEDFDYVIDLHHNIRSASFKRALGKQHFSFPKLNVEKWLRVVLKIDRLPTTHIVDRYLSTLSTFKIKDDGAGLDYFIPEKDVVPETDIPASHHAGYIAIVIGATYFTKRYPQEKLTKVCDELQHPIILIGSKEDAERAAEIAAKDPVKIYNACGKFNLNESADLVRRAKLVVSNDTGFMHVAAAFKRPIVSLWGNTIPAFGMTPFYGRNFQSNKPDTHRLLEVEGLSCRPCSKLGYNKCPRGHFKCMQHIMPETVTSAIRELL